MQSIHGTMPAARFRGIMTLMSDSCTKPMTIVQCIILSVPGTFVRATLLQASAAHLY
jgi:hypothetical protein